MAREKLPLLYFLAEQGNCSDKGIQNFVVPTCTFEDAWSLSACVPCSGDYGKWCGEDEEDWVRIYSEAHSEKMNGSVWKLWWRKNVDVFVQVVRRTGKQRLWNRHHWQYLKMAQSELSRPRFKQRIGPGHLQTSVANCAILSNDDYMYTFHEQFKILIGI